MKHCRSQFCLFLMGAALLLCSNLYAGQQNTLDIDPKVDQVMKQMSQYLNTLGQFTIHLENTEDKLAAYGRQIQYGNTVDVYVRRPDRLRADIKGDDRYQQFFYDGKKLTLFDRDAGLYSTIQAPPTLEATLDFAREHYGINMPAADIVAKNTYDILMENVSYAEYIGLHKVGGIQCHHLLFSQDEVDWQIWIEDSKTPLPRKIIITEKLVTGGPQFTTIFSNWNLSPQLPDDHFIFLPPEDAEEIEFLPVE